MCGLLRVRGIRTWEFVNFRIVVNTLRSLEVRAYRDPNSIKGFTPRDATVLPTYNGDFLYESGLSLLPPSV